MTYTPTEQANIDAMYRFMEAEAVQDWDTVYQFIAPDCVNYSPTGVVRGHEEMHRFDAAMFAGLQSWRRTILDIVADGDAVVFRWRAEARLRPSARQPSRISAARCAAWITASGAFQSPNSSRAIKSGLT